VFAPAQLAALALQCAMCYQNAAAQGAKGIQALNLGVLVLLLPPVAILGCISWAAYRRRGPTCRPPRTDGRFDE